MLTAAVSAVGSLLAHVSLRPSLKSKTVEFRREFYLPTLSPELAPRDLGNRAKPPASERGPIVLSTVMPVISFPDISPEKVAAISAVVTESLGRYVAIRSVRKLSPCSGVGSWAREGRICVHRAHEMRLPPKPVRLRADVAA
jgi:hypothetical protein